MRYTKNKKFLYLIMVILCGSFCTAASGEHWEYHNYTNGNDVQSLAAFGDYVWSSTSGGLLRWNINDQSYILISGKILGQICVDQKGKVWGFKNNALWKYNGLKWEDYPNNEINETYFKSISSDSNDNIWIVTTYAIFMYNGSAWQRFAEENGPPKGTEYSCIACDNKGNVWVSAYLAEKYPFTELLSKYDGKSWTTYTYTASSSTMSNFIYSLACDSQGNVWIGADDEILLFNGTFLKRFNYLNGFDNSEAYTTMALDLNGNVWAGMKYHNSFISRPYNKGISRYDGSKWITYTESSGLADIYTSSIVVDSKGNIWAGSMNGINVYDGIKWSNLVINTAPPDNRIYSVFVDSKSRIWINTPSGISMYDGTKWVRNDYAYGYHNAGFAEDAEGNIWVAGSESIWCFNGREWKSFSPPAGVLGGYTVDGNPWKNYITSISAYYGKIMMTSSLNLLSFDGTKWDIKSLIQNTDIFKSTNLTMNVLSYCHAVDTNGNIWIGRYLGASKFDGKVWTDYFNKGWAYDPQIPNIFGVEAQTNSIAVDHNGNLWFGTGGTSRSPYDPEFPWHICKGGTYKYDGSIWTSYKKKDGLADDYVTSIKVDSRGNVWFGTWGGLTVFDGSSWKTYTESDGLIDNMVMTISIDTHDNIWCGTYENGICCLVRDPLSVKNSETSLPGSFSIKGNHPNPFNPSTTISYYTPIQGNVELSVYSVTGQRVRTLFSGPLAAGSHSVVWDGRDDFGQPVSNGTYISRITSGKYSAAGKMLLLK